MVGNSVLTLRIFKPLRLLVLVDRTSPTIIAAPTTIRERRVMVLNNGAVILFVISWSVMNNESRYPLLVIRYDAISAWKFKSNFGKYQFSGKEPYLTNTFLQCTLFWIFYPYTSFIYAKIDQNHHFFKFQTSVKKEIQICHTDTLGLWKLMV